MTSRRTPMLLIVFGLALTAAAGLALAFRGPGAPGRGPGGEFGPGPALHRLASDPELQKSLGLTEDQITRLKKLADDNRDRILTQRAEVRAQRIRMRELAEDSATTRAAIEAQSAAVGKAVEELRSLMTGAMLDAREILTPAQRDRLRSELGRRIGEFRRGRGAMRGERPCPCWSDGAGGGPPCPFGHDGAVGGPPSSGGETEEEE